jgi:hypothetical protein
MVQQCGNRSRQQEPYRTFEEFFRHVTLRNCWAAEETSGSSNEYVFELTGKICPLMLSLSVRSQTINKIKPTKALKINLYLNTQFLYRTAVLYGCETWSLTSWEERRLRAIENRVLRRIFGHKRDELTAEWRKTT